MKRFLPLLIALALVVLAIVGARQGYALAKERIAWELSQPRSQNGLLILPEGFQFRGWGAQWKQITVSNAKWNLELDNPVLDLNLRALRGHGELLSVHSSRVQFLYYARERQPKRHHDSDSVLVLPLRRFPARFQLRVDTLQIEAQNIGQWQAENAWLHLTGPSSFAISSHLVQGTFLATPFAPLTAECGWNQDSLWAELHMKSNADYVDAEIRTALDNATGLVYQLNADINRPMDWLPPSIHLPAIVEKPTSLHVASNGFFDPRTNDGHWLLDTRLRLGGIWQIPPLRLHLSEKGSMRAGKLEKQKIDIHLKGDSREALEASLTTDSSLEVRGEVKISHINLQIGPRLQPADGQIKNLVLNSQGLTGTVITQAGSRVKAKHLNFSPFSASFEADIAPTEPWAVAWCDTNLELASPSKITGEYHKGVLSANVITGVKKAFPTKAERVETDLTLSKSGIHFDNGTIKENNQTFYWTGEVIWQHEDPHMSFHVEREGGGEASAWGNLGNLLDIGMEKLPLATLPLRDPPWRGMEIIATGKWNQDFLAQKGRAILSLQSQYKGRELQIDASAYQNGDSLVAENARVRADKSQINARAIVLQQADPTTGKKKYVVQEAAINTQDLELSSPLSTYYKPLLSSGHLSGMLAYRKDGGLSGRIEARNILFQGIPETGLSLPRIAVEALGDKARVTMRVKSGAKGEWNGELEMDAANIFSHAPSLQIAMATDHGGVIWFDGGIKDSSLQGTIQANGPWILPNGAGELASSSLSAQVHFGFKGDTTHKVTFVLDTATYMMGTLLNLKVHAQGGWNNGLVDIPIIKVFNPEKQELHAKVKYNTQSRELEDLSFSSAQFVLPLAGIHHVELQNLEGKAILDTNALSININFPVAFYNLNDPSLGKARGRLAGHALLKLPRKGSDGEARGNPTITGEAELHKFVFEKNLGLGSDWRNVRKGFGAIANFFSSIGKHNSNRNGRETQKATGTHPLELAFRIHESGKDSVMIVSDVLTVPLSLDLQVAGPPSAPLLNGDINSSGKGKLGIEGVTMFELQDLRINWSDNAVKDGQIDMTATHSLPYCTETDTRNATTCPVQLEVKGSLSSPVVQPSADCGTESTPAAVYYALWLGCVPPDDGTESVNYSEELNKWTGKMFGNLLSRGINWGAGTDLIGEVGIRYSFWGENQDAVSDSSYIRVPVQLDRFVKDLQLVFAYSRGTGQNPRFDQSTEVGLRYGLPLFDSTDESPGFLNPKADASGSVIARRYFATDEAAKEATRIEPTIGLSLSYQYWPYCVLGWGICPADTTTKTPLDTNGTH